MSEAASASAKIQTATVEGLLQFLDYVVEKGYGPTTAVGPWRSAVKQVFSTVEGDDYLALSLRGLDLEDFLGRFETLARTKGTYKVESLKAYRSRTTNAVEAYLDFIDTGRTPSFRQTGPRRQKTEAPKVVAPASPLTPTGHREAGHSLAGGEPMIDYPFPLRTGQVASLRLPARLEKADAERLAAFIRTLVFEPQLQIADKSEIGDDIS